MALDRVPGHANLNIGGLFTLKRKGALKTANITHVLSVLTLPLDDALFEGYQHLAIDVDDVDDADIIQHFSVTNAFIREGLEGGGGVLVHCAYGKSRSATIIIAYLLSTLFIETPTKALALLRQCRPMAQPNSGFWSQLELYHRMHCPQDILGNLQYQRWCWEREKKRSLLQQVVPGSEHIIFEDETLEPSMTEGTREKDEGKANHKDEAKEYRCRKCRRSLGGSEYVIPHSPSEKGQQQCSHLFLHPLSWMRSTLSEGLLEGRLDCPNEKCREKLGKYAWQGMKCSCGEWVVPGISLGRAKVDIVNQRI
ncbi:MAG: hypothetical protein L6R37_006855 [Teloschistes peruensis]|nr:MAG: hypothetical protein L6R37_006855 [Teloschistes peruensis]